MVTRSPKALIVGAGVAGPAAAILLKRAGFNVELFEAWPHSAGIGGGLQIAPNGMRVLAEIGPPGRDVPPSLDAIQGNHTSELAGADYRAAGVATTADERQHLLGAPHQLFEGTSSRRISAVWAARTRCISSRVLTIKSWMRRARSAVQYSTPSSTRSSAWLHQKFLDRSCRNLSVNRP